LISGGSNSSSLYSPVLLFQRLRLVIERSAGENRPTPACWYYAEQKIINRDEPSGRARGSSGNRDSAVFMS